jgi:hypothetical protein
MQTHRTSRRAALTGSIIWLTVSAFAHSALAELPYTLPPSVTIEKTSVPPTIDGHLSEGEWAGAAIIDQLIQVEPVEGGTPSERTVAYLMQDADALYVGVRCYDSQPDRIVSTVLTEDAAMLSDDRINLVLDTYHDQRNGYFFQTNALGSRSDGRIENNSNFRRQWDGIWYAKARIDDEGWTAEFAIPFKTLSFDAESSTWGFEIERMIRRKNERIRWSNISQSRSIVSIAPLGTIEGLSGMDQGIGLDIVPTLAGTYQWSSDAADKDFLLRPSLDIFYRVTPSLRLSATTNTDFSDAEVDERQTNLTRFSLFFPETRDFFLDGAEIFEFGGLSRNGIPFFSRRIGISPGGEPVDLAAGAKLAGRVGPLSIGLLDVQTRDDQGIEAQNLSVARIAYNLFEESRVGMIATNGTPDGVGQNTLLGGDFRYRNSRLDGGTIVQIDAFAQKSWSSELSDNDMSYGVAFDYPNDRVDINLEFTEIQRNFDPALGFVNRSDIRSYIADTRYRIRPQTWLRTIDFGINADIITDTDNEFSSSNVDLEIVRIANNPGDAIAAVYTLRREDLTADFEVVPGLTIAADDYSFDQYNLVFESSIGRPVSGEFSITWGEFFSGTIWSTTALLELRPTPHLFVALEHEYDDAHQDAGNFEVHLARTRFNVSLNPEISWNSFLQWDDLSNNVAVNSRVRWIIEPGNEFVLVWNQGMVVEDHELHSTTSEVTTKLSWTYRF